MIDNTYPEFIFSALWIVPVIAAVAVMAYVNKNRLMFWFGLAGCFAGLFFDRGGSTGGVLDHASVRAYGFLLFGIVGATTGCVSAWALHEYGRLKKQFSIRALVVVTALLAIALALYKSTAS